MGYFSYFVLWIQCDGVWIWDSTHRSFSDARCVRRSFQREGIHTRLRIFASESEVNKAIEVLQ